MSSFHFMFIMGSLIIEMSLDSFEQNRALWNVVMQYAKLEYDHYSFELGL